MKKRLRQKLIHRDSRMASGPVGQMRTLSDLTDRAELAGLAGLSFGGKRDLFKALGYDRKLGVKKYRDRYTRNGIAKRIVESGPRATWRGGAELIEDEDPEVSTEFEKAFLELDKRLHVWATLCRLDILAGIGRYAVLLIGTRDSGDLSTELTGTFDAKDILYLQPYGEDEAVIQTWDEDPKSERFGMPQTYTLTRSTQQSSSRVTTTSLNVHWSRVLHVASDVLDEVVYGQPRLESIWNYLDDLDKVTGGGSEAFWMRVNKGLALSLDKELSLDESTPDGAAKVKSLKHQLEEYEHKLRRLLVVQGFDIKELGGDVANFAAQVDSILTLLAGSTGIPKRILLGSERGELASTQDATNWDTQVEDRRDQFAKPYVLAPLVNMFIKLGVLPEPEQWDVRWPSLVQLDEQGKADLAKKYKDLGQTIATDAEIRDRVLGWPALTDEQKAEIAASQPVPPTPATSEEEVGVLKAGKNAAQPPKPPAEMTAAEKQIEEERQQEEARNAGGPGSGFFGHGGRPGEVGGSSGGGEVSTRETTLTQFHLEQMPRDGYVLNEKGLATEEGARQEFERAVKKQFPLGVMLFHESPLANAASIAKSGLPESSFYTLGKPSGFVTDQDKVIVAVPLSLAQSKELAPDMRYVSEHGTPYADLLREHKGVYNADVSHADPVSPKNMTIYIQRSGKTTLEELRSSSSRAAAASRKPSLAQLRIDSVAKKREASLTGKLLSAFRRAKRALSAKLLAHAASTGAQTMVEFEVGKAFGELERKTLPEVARELRKTVVAGGDAAARSIHLHGVPLGTKKDAQA